MEGSQNRKWRWNYWSPQTPLADKFLHGAIVPANAYHRTKFQLPSSNSFRDKEGVPKFNVGDTTPLPPYAGILRVLQVRGKVKQPAKFQHRISMHHAVMRICISHRLSVICAQKWSLGGGLRVKMWKYVVLTSKRHYPAWIRVCSCIACQNRFNCLSSMSVERFCVQRKKEIKQELSYRKQIARQLRTQYVESIYRPKYYTVTLKSRLTSLKVTNGTIG